VGIISYYLPERIDTNILNTQFVLIWAASTVSNRPGLGGKQSIKQISHPWGRWEFHIQSYEILPVQRSGRRRDDGLDLIKLIPRRILGRLM
jgi:hypothetical protein